MRFRFILAAVFCAAFGLAPALSAADTGDSPAYHLYPMPSARASIPKPFSGSANPSMLYYGGPVISHVKIVAVMWGPKVNATTATQIGGFLRAIAKSTFVDQLSEYATDLKAANGRNGTNQKIGRGIFRGKFTITPKNMARLVSDSAIQAELRGQIAAGKLPKADLGTLYVVYFPSNITISSFGKSCVAFGAYHSAASSKVTPDNLFYAVMPDCGRGFAGLTVASSHEIAEAISDAIPTPGSHPEYPQAWNTSDGFEIADLCEDGPATKLIAASQRYSVTRVYLNSLRRCAARTYTSP